MGGVVYWLKKVHKNESSDSYWSVAAVRLQACAITIGVTSRHQPIDDAKWEKHGKGNFLDTYFAIPM